MTRKGRLPPLLARVTCLQQVINCIAYVAGVERDGGGGGRKGGIRERGFSLFPIALFSPSPPPFLCACLAGYQLQWMLLEMSLTLLSRLRAVSLLLKNLWGSGISEYREQCVVRAPVPASWRQHNTGAACGFAARILEYPTLSQIFEQEQSGTKKRLLAVFLLSVTKQINGSISKSWYSFLIMFIYM